ncbi:MAG: tetratricopeptide repeat protein [Methanoregulaceae archaeon]|nr:tetratricopeptide repeat protein [Methanoregulaceae archaeon]
MSITTGILVVLLLLVLAYPAMAAGPELTGQNIDAINAYNTGADLASQGRYREALEATDHALSIQPDFSLAWTQKAGLLVVLGRNEEALNASDRALEGNANISEAWASRADALNNLGRYGEAVNSAEKAVSLDPGLAEGWANVATAYGHLGRYSEALEAAEKALEINPSLEAAQSAKKFATAMMQQTTVPSPSATGSPLSPVIPLLGAGLVIVAFAARGRK